ncbi:FAD-dependent oxidoreductase [Dyadobacter sp. MSC1_007]|jgi:ribulose 1,5-bisphosphate synthetase/thiazole synthase|uniref:FAD-dependent oxidoreductase n=1 Tax=Dyadobacter sp. MSC1_007 TaxID=2909264 RepID=UPI00202F4517|nr:FAD-dependent oxidoreductase [Dyadobacter sp. MSC1_007]
MDRRKFLNLTLPATGAVFLTSSMLSEQAMAEIGQQFDGKNATGHYDIVINGAGLSGYFAALHASSKGKKVLIVEKRSSPGFELAAKSKLWLHAQGFDALRPDLQELLSPEQELPEIKNTKGTGKGKSQLGDHIALFKGSIRKGMVRNLLVGKVDILLMTDTCGLFESKGQVSGVLLATKQGVFSVPCKTFIDASDQLLFSRRLAEKSLKVQKAGFVIEVNNVNNPTFKEIKTDASFGLEGNRLTLYPGKLSNDQAFLAFEYPVDTDKLEEIEHKGRQIATQLGAKIKTLGTGFSTAQIQQFALEASLTLADNTPPATSLNGHYVLDSHASMLSLPSLMALEKNAQTLVDRIKIPAQTAAPQTLVLPGKKLDIKKVKFQAIDEPGFNVPLQAVHLDWIDAIVARKQTQVIVAGGGTAGALAAAGSVEKGADTIVVDYFNDLGGTKTMGGVMGYYHGVKDNVFFKKQNDEAERLALEVNMNKKVGRQIYHLRSVVDKGGQFLTSAILCGAVTKDNAVKGVVICRHGQLELILGDVTIDATGDGDVAAKAGASFQIGDSRIGFTQNYSQWDIAGSGKLPSATNRDYDILDNTKVSEQQRGLFISHYEAHCYDFHPFLTVRESRRIDGIHNLDLIDCVEKRHFEDVLTLASSDFDPHNVASSEYSKCGFLLPHSNDITVEIPYRSIIPKKLDGLLMSGRGFGQSRNALQFTRMTADLLVLGYLTGQIAADIAWKKVRPRDYNVSALQNEWVALGYLPAELLRKKPGDLRANRAEIERRVQQLESGASEYLYECSRIEKSLILPLIKEWFEKTNRPDGKLLLAKMLAWFGDAGGNELIGAELTNLFELEQEDGYPKGYIDDYDNIRGREKNKLEGLFWKINQNIALLGMSGNGSEMKAIRYILEKTGSGGGMVPRSNDYFNERIDIKIIPFHNRILSLAMYAERIPDPSLISGFENLLKDPNIGGYVTSQYDKVRWKVHGGALEISIAAAMARCGSQKGYELLQTYLDDLHFNYKSFALSELHELTGKDWGHKSQSWQKYLAGLSYPQPVKALKKEIEI